MAKSAVATRSVDLEPIDRLTHDPDDAVRARAEHCARRLRSLSGLTQEALP